MGVKYMRILHASPISRYLIDIGGAETDMLFARSHVAAVFVFAWI